MSTKRTARELMPLFGMGLDIKIEYVKAGKTALMSDLRPDVAASGRPTKRVLRICENGRWTRRTNSDALLFDVTALIVCRKYGDEERYPLPR